ncbi:Lrp/AsnC family transcriptional regulator [Thauera phenolivorans]|uniref:Lrp/AsnC family transcriptional regulator n=1 Tax=Thauera phenolivorans TaxID=1792543 RepID=UPI00083AC759|nr:AsnC family transcriptional regulator [Thauera phenolivorans]
MSERRRLAAARAPDETDRRLINALQGEFPLSERPFAEVGAALGLAEDEVIARLQAMLDDRVLTRFGPMYQIERMGGAFCLAAIAVPEADWARVVEAVNAFPEVAHNYRREHRLNMWFVLATETPGGIADVGRRIEAATGLKVHLFPKEKEYFVEMRLEA